MYEKMKAEYEQRERAREKAEKERRDYDEKMKAEYDQRERDREQAEKKEEGGLLATAAEAMQVYVVGALINYLLP